MRFSHRHYLAVIFIGMFLSSCYVRHPRYSMVKEVMNVQIGMSFDSVNAVLGQEPYDVLSVNNSGETVYIYKYRVQDIKRIPILMKRNKGVETAGRFRDLQITYSEGGKVLSYKTNDETKESKVEKKKIDPNVIINSVLTAITITIPAILVYLSF